MDNKIIVVAGPTASGKTSLGIEIARAVNGEIISADSMQVYKGMPVATACPTKEEQTLAKHHLVEFLDPDDDFSVAAWCTLAKEKINDILSRNKVPVIVGGTGLFIDSLVDNIAFENIEVNQSLRDELMEKDCDYLYNELLKLDGEAAKNIHKNNKKRVVRALELCYGGVTKTAQNENSKKEPSPYDSLYIVLDYNDRQKLYDRINKRVDIMLEQGLEDEARANMNCKKSTSAQAIGHKELYPYINGEINLKDAVETLKQKTRNYAKRQITWFKKRKDAVFLSPDLMTGEQLREKAIKLCEDFINGQFQKGKSE